MILIYLYDKNCRFISSRKVSLFNCDELPYTKLDDLESKYQLFFISFYVLYYVIIASSIRPNKQINYLGWIFHIEHLPGQYCPLFLLCRRRETDQQPQYRHMGMGTVCGQSEILPGPFNSNIIFNQDITMWSLTTSFSSRTVTGSGCWPTQTIGKLS